MKRKLALKLLAAILVGALGNRIFNHVSAWGGIFIAVCAIAYGINTIYQLFKNQHSQQ